MIQEYLQKAMQLAQYEILEDNEGFYGSIPSATGVWATGSTLEECRQELLEVLEEWILIGIAQGHQLPEFDGVSVDDFREATTTVLTNCHECENF